MTGYHLILRWNASSGVSDWRRASEKFHNRLQKGSKPCMVPGWGEAGLGSSRRRSYRPTGVGSIERAATNAIMFLRRWRGGGAPGLNSAFVWQDIQAHREGGMLAVSTSDTVEHDIARMGEEQIAVYRLQRYDTLVVFTFLPHLSPHNWWPIETFL